jgi:hypothetical protein
MQDASAYERQADIKINEDALKDMQAEVQSLILMWIKSLSSTP